MRLVAQQSMLRCFFLPLTAMLIASVSASRPALTLIEHALPLMEPQRYESALRAAMAPQGEMVRWAISRVDEETATAYAEVVLSLHPEVDVKVTRPGIRRMLSMPSESQG